MTRILMPLIGESFRIGGQGSRTRGGVYSISLQKLATYSHLRFIKYMKEKNNIDVDIVFITYKESEEELNALEKWYGKYLVNKIYFNYKFSSEVDLFQHAGYFLKSINIFDHYDYIFLMRFDFYIKEYFQNILFKLNPEKVIYTHRDLNEFRDENDWKYVGHYCMVVPKKFFNYITDGALWTSKHETFKYLELHEGNNSYEILVNVPHWSSSCLGYNPFFTMVGREDYNKYDYESEKYKEMHSYTFQTNIYDNIINTDTIDMNLSKFLFTNSLDDDFTNNI